MSEPTIQIDHQATLQPSPITRPPEPAAPVSPLTSVNQYRSPLNAGPDRYQEPVQFLENPADPAPPAEPLSFSPLASNPQPQPQSSQNIAAETTQQPPQPTSPSDNNASSSTGYFPGINKPMPEEVVLEWLAPSRPHKQRQKQYFTTVAIFVFLIALILFFLSQFLLIGVVLAVAFLVYVLEVVPPTMVRNQISTYGVRVENNLYYWDELGRFWFTQKYTQPVLHIEVARFPGRLTILLGDISQKEMSDLLSEVLLFQRPEPTAFEKASERLQQLIPLENDAAAQSTQPPQSAQPSPPSS